ncbi:hypothetical protein LSS_09204 [Leptospira santarosai serovar Shermani str. LT 821]|uniref:Uncharacterized protein n=1 Tax=Leptospira santarosai serovar Shermani str. LT 821 TaxID=758847 RepID=K8Y1Z4_9LEPT|nr:hypothetical protein LSS_09204 [Leptospira santarosai serovar Shermani str. LT 821]
MIFFANPVRIWVETRPRCLRITKRDDENFPRNLPISENHTISQLLFTGNLSELRQTYFSLVPRTKKPDFA